MGRPNIAVREDEVLMMLAALNVDRAILEDVARSGEWARNSAHPFDTVTHPGESAHNMRIRRLGILLQPRGYVRVNHRGAAFVYHEELRVAITTSTGDENTANPSAHHHPRTRSPKGGVTITVAAQNRSEQPDLDGFVYTGEIKPTPIAMPDDVEVFHFVVNPDGENISTELSAPVRMDSAAHIVEWRPRIILGTFAIGEPGDTNDDGDGDDGPSNFRVSYRGS